MKADPPASGGVTTELDLSERRLARMLEGVEVSAEPRHVIGRIEDRSICLVVVAPDNEDEQWPSYREAAARRARVSGDWLLPLVLTAQMEGVFCVAYEIGEAVPFAAHRDVAEASTQFSLQLLWGVGRALDQAAEAGLYATELTPGSVFVHRTRGAQLADLGVAREALGNPPSDQDANAPWIAPEILREEGAADRSAVYSFGALMYTMLTGDPPHRGTVEEIAEAQAPSLRDVRPDLPEALDLVVSTAMARDPRERYPTASEARSIAQIVLLSDLQTERPGFVERFRRSHEPASLASTPGPASVEPESEPSAPPPFPPAVDDQVDARARERAAKRHRDSERAAERDRGRAARKKRANELRVKREEERVARDRRRIELSAQRGRRRGAEERATAEAAAPQNGTEELARVRHETGEQERAVAGRRPAAVLTPPVSRTRSRVGALALVLIGLALALGALAGVQLGGPADAEPATPQSLSTGAFGLRLPVGWQGSTEEGRAEAHPFADPGSGLTLALVDEPVEAAEQANPVRLGRLEAWREPAADVPGASRAVRYVVPTENGKLVATCRASQRAAPNTLALCERAASTLRLRSATGLSLAAVVEQQARRQAAVEALSEARSTARTRLAAAERPNGQLVAAEALVRVHERAAERFGELPGGEAIAAAARRTAAAYGGLAEASGGEASTGWNAARARVRRAEAALRRAIAAP